MGPESAKSHGGKALVCFRPQEPQDTRQRSGPRRDRLWSVRRATSLARSVNVHRATDVLLFVLAHPRWEFAFQPKYAAYLNLIEPWWKALRSLALKRRRFAT